MKNFNTSCLVLRTQTKKGLVVVVESVSVRFVGLKARSFPLHRTFHISRKVDMLTISKGFFLRTEWKMWPLGLFKVSTIK